LNVCRDNIGNIRVLGIYSGVKIKKIK